MAIKILKLQCEFITPTFIFGANQKCIELRVPSIKGSIRYWWRASYGNTPIEDLFETEASIFGGVGESVGKSKVQIKIKDNLQSNSIYPSLLENEIKKTGYNYDPPGIGYNFYSVVMDSTNQKPKPCIKPNTRFGMDLIFKENRYADEFLRGLLMLQYFGGIGSRNRRGAGSLRVNVEDGEKYGLLNLDLFDTSNINTREQLMNRIIEIGQLMCEPIVNSYSILKGSRIFIFEHTNDWKSALESIASLFKTFRNNNKNKVTSTPNFGFPILHRKTKVKMGACKDNNKDTLERRSSPIIFKILKCGGNYYFPLIIYLNGELIPEEYKITNLNNLDDSELMRRPDKAIINEFLQSISDDSVEVIL